MISVIIASYKYGHLAAHAIDSVLSQTRSPERILFVDDGVGDCEHLPSLYPEVEFVLRDDNLGTVANFNDMLQRVEGRVLFLGADNWLRQDTLETLSQHNADIVSYDIAITGTEGYQFANSRARSYRDGYPIWQFSPKNIEVENYIHGSSLYNADMAKQYGYRHSGKANSEEDHMLFREMLRNGAAHTHVSEPLLYYRRHRENFNGNY